MPLPRTPCSAWPVVCLVLGAALAPAAMSQPMPVGDGSTGKLAAGWSYPSQEPATPANLRRLRVPDGFGISVFARDAGHARMLLALDDGSVLVSRPKTNDVLRLFDADGDGVAEGRAVVARNLRKVHGLARSGRQVYLAGEHSVWVSTLAADGSLSAPRELVGDLPDGGQHPHRTVGVGPDGWLYVSIGSTCNACSEPNPEHAAMLRMRPDGSGRAVHASGLRNTIGFGWHPQTGELWGLDHGSDWRGDDLPPEELNRIVAGGHYGWPFCWGKRQPDPTRDDPPDTTQERFCAASRPSERELPAHAAPIGLVFYDSDQFPAAYRHHAFAAMRGSWNRTRPREPRIVRIHFENGRPAGEENFVTGFLSPNGRSWFGRLAGVAVARDGALLFSDDMNGVVYRVSTAARQ